MREYVEAKGGKLKCLPLSFMQSNFAYFYSQRNSFIDSCMKDVKSLEKNYVKALDYSSGEDDEYRENEV